MGFSSLAVITGIISQVYDIDLRTRELYQRKFRLGKFNQYVGIMQGRNAMLDKGQVQRVRLLNFGIPLADGSMYPQLSQARFQNQFGAGGAPIISSEGLFGNIDAGMDPTTRMAPLPPVVLLNSDGSMAAAGQPVYVDISNPAAGTLQEGEVYMQKEEAEALFRNYMTQLSNIEKEIDMQLEQLKAQRTALVSQREEYTKYLSEGIKTTFKNNYA